MLYKQHNKHESTQRERADERTRGEDAGARHRREVTRSERRRFQSVPIYQPRNISREHFKSAVIDAHITALNSLEQYRTRGQSVRQKALFILKPLRRR